MAREELFRVETNILPTAKLILVFSGLSFVLLIGFVDQNAIGIALPTIGEDLNAANTIAWAGTSSLIANTCFQVLYGRLSDIFGRKSIFLSAVALLALGDLLCGFARTGPELYAYRAIAGVAGGGIGAISMVIVSDIVTLENRGKYQGILGSCVGVGNVVGPFLAAAFIQTTTWRALFWCIAPCAAVSGIVVAFILPPSNVIGNSKDKVKAIDFLGIACSTIAILLILIPVSGGGTYFSWSSPMSISMLAIGGVAAIAFIIIEWKVARMPMMPLRLFKIPAVGAILAQNFLFGIVYYCHLYYLPIYYQNTRQYSPLLSATLLIPFVVAQSISSIISGQYVSRTKRYGEVIWVGYGLWTLGTGLILLFDRETSIWKIAVILAVEGFGVGNVFQPTLIASQAHSKKADRAVVISVRNFLRSLGGAVGLALSSAVFSNVLAENLTTVATSLPASVIESILERVLSIPNLAPLNAIQQEEVLDSYMAASRAVFLMWTPMMGICLLSCLFIKDRGLTRPDEAEEVAEENTETELRILQGSQHSLREDVPRLGNLEGSKVGSKGP